MENYYNSVDLAQKLISKNTYCTGGHYVQIGKNIRTTLLKKKEFKKREIISTYSNDGICVLKWKDKRDVLGVSTEWTADMVDTRNRRGDKKKKSHCQ